MTPRIARPLMLVLMAALVVSIGALPTLAMASASDPSWIDGIYDSADFDDVVALITSAAGHAPPTGVGTVDPLPERPEPIQPAAQRTVAARPSSALPARAPPV